MNKSTIVDGIMGMRSLTGDWNTAKSCISKNYCMVSWLHHGVKEKFWFVFNLKKKCYPVILYWQN